MTESLKRELSTYFEIMQNKRLSRLKIAETIDAFHENKIDSLWKEHEKIHMNFKNIFEKAAVIKTKKSSFSYLDLKIKIAEEIYKNCYLCEKRCYVDRNIEKGYCNVGEPKIASEFLHMSEEVLLVPSHTIFFAGCNFECIYCQNYDISQFPES
ncbi:hypothetical protein [Methanobacterium sp. ACI-7]|uniref:hypothetical protein n=1 Tax=unclassified Methanobacterium TaxID=2627676 RepID=UPI0039C2B34A